MPVSVRLPQAFDERLTALAALTNRSKSFYLREALVQCIDELEDIYIAEKRLENLRQDKSKTTPLKEVMKEYGMEG